MRQVSADAIQSLFAEHAESTWIPAVSIVDPTNTYSTLRACANTRDVSHGGNTYTACPFDWILADDTERSVAQAKIRVDNVDQSLTAVLRTVGVRPIIDLELFRVDVNGLVHREMGPSRFALLSYNGSAVTIEGTLGYENDFLNESAQQYSFTPTLSPGLFAA